MKKILCVLLLAVIVSTAAWAQHSHGYLFVAPGGLTARGHTDTTFHVGGGAEGVLGKGIGVGAELGALFPTGEPSAVVGLFSLNGYYHFLHNDKADPFATGGYSLLFRSGSASLGNFGGGVNYWFVSRVGLKLEFRDHVYSSGVTIHHWGFRLGLTFR